jgi:poly-gamma-glutamate capsule biosynthesis protein CapA/YwtB (metallophosphatase superfamily)
MQLTNLSLANNHILDYGIEGFKQTLEGLHEHKIRFFGAGYIIASIELTSVNSVYIELTSINIVRQIDVLSCDVILKS